MLTHFSVMPGLDPGMTEMSKPFWVAPGSPGQARGCPVEEKSQPKRVYLGSIFYFIVILGLDPRIQGLSKQFSVAPGLPGQARQ
jgi:hypothetical protein